MLSETDAEALREYLQTLETETAKRLIDAPGPAADYALDEPELVAHIVDMEAQHDLIVGTQDGKIYARSSEPRPAYEMSADYLAQARRLAASTPSGDGEGAENPGSSAAPA